MALRAGRGLAGLAVRRRSAVPVRPLGARCASLGIDTIEAPRYAKVPVVQESPEAIMAEMPELILSGPGLAEKPGDEQARLKDLFSGGMLDEAIELDAPSTGPSATSSDASPEMRFAELPNGCKIVGVDRHGLCASLGLFLHAGSRYEEAESACLPHALELMAFRSTAHLSHMRTLKTMEQLGAAASCRVGREDILFQFDVLREYVPVALPLMLSNVLCPSILPEEVFELQQQIPEVQHNLEENPETMMAEALHITAYKDNTLGHQLYATEAQIPLLTAESIQAYIQRECTPDRMIVVGVNVDFDELCKWTAREFAEHAGAAAETAVERKPRVMAPAVYTGGDHRVEAPNPLCHLMFGWEVAGGWNGANLAAITVLQMFLGGGGSFSTGGPGKGMHTRMYTEVLNKHHWVESCQASSVMYADSGLFTVYATVVPQHADNFISVLSRIFQGVARISPEEMQRAKNALKSSIHMNLEMRAVMMEDIGRQLILSGKVGSAQEFGRMVDAVTHEDLLVALRECLLTEPTVVAYGAVEKVPSYEQIKKRLAWYDPTARPS